MSELGPTLTSSDRTATDELRRMLDERGVKHEGERSVRWRDRNGVIMQAFPLASGELGLEVWSCTPEQAIAATLDDTDATAMRQDYADLVAENAELRETLKRRNRQFETMTDMWAARGAKNAKLRKLADAVKEFVEDTHCEDCPCRRDCDDNNSIFCANDFSYHAFAAMRELGVGVSE